LFSGLFGAAAAARRRGVGAAGLVLHHPALALEDDALVDEELGRHDVPDELARCMDFHEISGLDVAVDQAATDDQRRDLDLGLDLGALADDQDVVGVDFPGELSIDPDSSLERELAVELGALPEQGIDLAAIVRHGSRPLCCGCATVLENRRGVKDRGPGGITSAGMNVHSVTAGVGSDAQSVCRTIRHPPGSGSQPTGSLRPPIWQPSCKRRAAMTTLGWGGHTGGLGSEGGASTPPPLVYEGPVDVALVDAGEDPLAVARALQDLMLLTITRPDALADATPLILFRGVGRPVADRVRSTLQRAGAAIELRAPRTPSTGYRPKVPLKS
jgi:hypothetical protein